MLIRIAPRLALLLVILGTVGCDHVTKHIATAELSGRPVQSFLGDTVRLLYAENVGGFLSLGANLPSAARTAVFTFAVGAFLTAVMLVALRLRQSTWHLAGLALVIGGGFSNWIDRAVTGSVVDFMNIGIGWLRTGVFNVADVALMAGAAILLVAELRKGAQGGTR